jgi:hypothetical protein
MWGEGIKLDDKAMTWAEITKEIDWDYGSTLRSRVKLLESTRHRLKRLRASDPDHLLEEAGRRLRELKEERKERKTAA